MDAAGSAVGPATEAERILALDALRGLGVLGILVMNWMRNFYFGPLEWLWRSLTYMEREPLRRPAPQPVAV